MNEPNGNNSQTCGCAAECSYKERGIRKDDLPGEADRMCRVVEELRILFNVSKTLQESPGLGEIVAPVLKQMAESLGLYRGAVRILNRETREIVIDEAFGLSAEEMAASRIQLGEGVIGQVAKTGKPVIIPDIEDADQSIQPGCAGFKGQTIQRPGATAFLCVPIIHGNDVMGTLSGYITDIEWRGVQGKTVWGGTEVGTHYEQIRISFPIWSAAGTPRRAGRTHGVCCNKPEVPA